MNTLGTLAQLLLSTEVRLRYSLYQQIINTSSSCHPNLMYSLSLIEQLQHVRSVPSALNIERKASRIFINDIVQHAISYKWYLQGIFHSVRLREFYSILMLHVCIIDVLFANK